MTIDWKDAVARAVRRHRADLKISQEALAEAASLSRNYVSSVESASVDFSFVVFTRLAIALGVRPWELLREAEQALPSRKKVSKRVAATPALQAATNSVRKPTTRKASRP